MLIAQALGEYGLMATLVEGIHHLVARIQDTFGSSALTWAGIGAAVVVVMMLKKR